MSKNKSKFNYEFLRRFYLEEIDALLKLDRASRLRAIASYVIFYSVLLLFGITAAFHFDGQIRSFIILFAAVTLVGGMIPITVVLLFPKRTKLHKQVHIGLLIVSSLFGFFWGMWITSNIDSSIGEVNDYGKYFSFIWLFAIVLWQKGMLMYNRLTKKVFTKIQQKEDELLLAKEIQNRFLPNIEHVDDEIEIFGSTSLASEVGGDYFDAIKTESGWVIAVGDVSGHGMAAGLMMTSIRSLCRAEIRHQSDLGKILDELNIYILEHAQRRLFMTFSLVDINFDDQTITYANAGHLPTLVKLKSNLITEYKPKGIGLGISSKAIYHTETHGLSNVEALTICTDGILEKRNKAGEEYGWERYIDMFKERNIEKGFNESLLKDVEMFSDDENQRDDETILTLKLKAESKSLIESN